MSARHRPLPEPTPETRHFWDGTRAGNLDSVADLDTDLVPVHCDIYLHTVFVNLSDKPQPLGCDN